MENYEGKHFSITDQQNVNTIVYKLDETEKEYAQNAPKFTIQRLDYTEEFIGERKRKTSIRLFKNFCWNNLTFRLMVI